MLCQGTTLENKPCKLPAMGGKDYCKHHLSQAACAFTPAKSGRRARSPPRRRAGGQETKAVTPTVAPAAAKALTPAARRSGRLHTQPAQRASYAAPESTAPECRACMGAL